MQRNELNRRDFHRLTMAAFGGALAGAQIGCGRQDEKPEEAIAGAKIGQGLQLLAREPHVCRGLNTCKGRGADKANACAGRGTCATVEKHTCGGQNACRGQGGCGEHPGQNDCKGQGHCSIPLMNDEVWQKARTAFEEAMKAAGTKVGNAPDKA